MTPQKHWPAPKQPPPFDILTVATKNLFYERCLKHQKPDIFPNPNAMDAPLDFNDISVGTPFSVMTRAPDILYSKGRSYTSSCCTLNPWTYDPCNFLTACLASFLDPIWTNPNPPGLLATQQLITWPWGEKISSITIFIHNIHISWLTIIFLLITVCLRPPMNTLHLLSHVFLLVFLTLFTL